MNRRIDTGVALRWTVSAAAGKANIGRGRVECAVFHTALLPILGGLLAVLGFTVVFAGMMAIVPTSMPVRVAGAQAITADNLNPTGPGWNAPRVANATHTCTDRTLAIPLCREIARAPGSPQTIAAPRTTTGPFSGEGRTLDIPAATPPPIPHAAIFPAMARAHFASPEMRGVADPSASPPSDLREDLAAMAESQRPIGLPAVRGELADCHPAFGCSGPSAPWRPEQQPEVAASPRVESASLERHR